MTQAGAVVRRAGYPSLGTPPAPPSRRAWRAHVDMCEWSHGRHDRGLHALDRFLWMRYLPQPNAMKGENIEKGLTDG
ncbi:hypothetical protein E2C01_020926 [Portunus trituberculatus]|uniref:Uncharacterized protein n=1 Tax=Portunus trituberculatus TaxID=210409 RepID=A0A5B7E329_PORTR|nr:hypothetical protein [Portunus trituberculatus]